MRSSIQPISIVDPASGTRAEVNPGLGFNCTAFQVLSEGEPIDVIWVPEGFGVEERKLYKGGVPILFPFAGRIRDARFAFLGAEYRLPEEDGLGNALHGFVLNRPWRVMECSASRVAGRFRASVIDPGLLRMWPADFELTVAYEVRGRELHMSYTVRNVDDSCPLPCGFGLHPYFAVPLPGGGIDSCLVSVPASSYWELDSRLLPTGRVLPVSGWRDLRNGRAVCQMEMDDVLGNLTVADGVSTVSIWDKGTGHRIWMVFPEAFRCCVVFTPPHRQAVCIEPYTCFPDAVSGSLVDKEATGLFVLEPGECVSGWVSMGVTMGAK